MAVCAAELVTFPAVCSCFAPALNISTVLRWITASHTNTYSFRSCLVNHRSGPELTKTAAVSNMMEIQAGVERKLIGHWNRRGQRDPAARQREELVIRRKTDRIFFKYLQETVCVMGWMCRTPAGDPWMYRWRCLTCSFKHSVQQCVCRHVQRDPAICACSPQTSTINTLSRHCSQTNLLSRTPHLNSIFRLAKGRISQV